MDFYEILQEIMDEQGLNIPAVARACGLSDGTVRSIFVRKQKNVALEVAFKLSSGLNVSLERLNGLPEKHTKITPLYSSEAMQLAQDYDSLGNWGKKTIRLAMSQEVARHEDEIEYHKLLDEDPQIEKESKVVHLFLVPSAAGYASPIFGEDYEDYTLTDDDPQDANFAIRVQGDSMEPYFPDGSIVFCNRDPLVDGDIGVFCVDGESYIKQYHYDRMMGMTYLFSLNRKRANMDKVIPRDTGSYMACLGRVITRRKYPVPGSR